MAPRVVALSSTRAGYASARSLRTNLEDRRRGGTTRRLSGLPAEVDYVADGQLQTIQVRDYDVRFLDRVDPAAAVAHLERLLRAREGDPEARRVLEEQGRVLLERLSARFAGRRLVEDPYVVPYTSDRAHTREEVSNKGANLLALARRGFPTADFVILSSRVLPLTPGERHEHARSALHDLELLSGRHLGDPAHPLLVALRSAMPAYLPGVMPTFLNVGYTEALLPGLRARYGEAAAARIRLGNRRVLLEALDPAAHGRLEPFLHEAAGEADCHRLAEVAEARIREFAAGCLDDPDAQVLLLLDRIRSFYEEHADILRSFAGGRTAWPSVILQRMVCSVIDDASSAGVLFSRHPATGRGACLQYARAVYGEELMTGRLVPSEVTLHQREDARASFPAVYHFWPHLRELEASFQGPVVVEFTAVHGTFTLLQVDAAELTGPGMLAAAVALHREGVIPAARVRELVRPHHLRQVEAESIDPGSLAGLAPFARGTSVLPRSAVTGRACFSLDGVQRVRRQWRGDRVVLIQERFTPADAPALGEVDGICSASPAAIHVVTHAQAHGVPALLGLETGGVTVEPEARQARNAAGEAVQEGEWVTISSRHGTIYRGRAVYVPARLLRHLAGEEVPLAPGEAPAFEALVADWRAFRATIEEAGPAAFRSLEDLGQAMRHGRLRDAPEEAGALVNACYDADPDQVAGRLLQTTLGNHLVHRTAFQALAPARQLDLLRRAMAASAVHGHQGFTAGAFVLGSLVEVASSVAFWRALAPGEVARLVLEWLLHRKYLALMQELGERRLGRMRARLLDGTLDALSLEPEDVRGLLPLKLAEVDLGAVRAAVPPGADPQLLAVLDLLVQPLSSFYDLDRPWGREALRQLLAREGLSLPDPPEG